MLNHRGTITSDVSYEYFGDKFVVTTDNAVATGGEALISYGKRPNSELVMHCRNMRMMDWCSRHNL